ncbi:MAG: hypothetical protein AAGA62_15435, partial [Bacteroidota bacterium]
NAVAITMENIQGSWNLTGMDVNAEITISDGIQTENSTIVSTIANSTVVMTFNADGTWSSTGMVEVTTTDEDGTETTELTDGVGSGTYTVTNGVVCIAGIYAGNEADVEDPVPYTVTRFQPGSLLVLDGSAMESVDFFGATLSLDLEQEITLEQ